MHVLVTEAQFGNADRIVRRLRDHGVRVSSCHDRVGYCRALPPGGRCPLDEITDPVDLVVDVRGGGDELTVREYGVVCAARAMRDVVVVPAEPATPASVPVGLRGIATAVEEDELVASCQSDSPTRRAAESGWPGRPADWSGGPTGWLR